MVLLLGHVFNLMTSTNEEALELDLESIEMCPTSSRRPKRRGWFTRPKIYGAAKCGEIEIREDGLFIRDDFKNSGWVRVGDVPSGFSLSPSSNAVVRCIAEDDTVNGWAIVHLETAAGDLAMMKVNRNSVVSVIWEKTDAEEEDVPYLKRIAAKMFGASNRRFWQ